MFIFFIVIMYILFYFCLGFFFFYGLLTFIEDKKKEYFNKDYEIRNLHHEIRMLEEKNKKSYFQGLNNGKKI